MRSKAIEDKFYWLKHIKNYKDSGMNKNRYCNQHGIKYHRFLYWFDKLLSNVLQPEPVNKKTNKSNQFIKVKLSPEAKQITHSPKPLCTLELKQGHRLLVHNESVLAKVLSLLSE